MQDNEFEKQVREKLARMQMDASDTVWQRVEDGLTGERKRRRGLIWIPLGAVLLVAGYFFTEGINGYKPAEKVVQSTTGSVSPKTTGTGMPAEKPESGSPDPSKTTKLSATASPEKRADGGNSKSSESDVLRQASKERTVDSATARHSKSSGLVVTRQASEDHTIRSVNSKDKTGQKPQLVSTLIARQQHDKSSKAQERNGMPGNISHAATNQPAADTASENKLSDADNTSDKNLISESASVIATDSINPAIIKAGLNEVSEIKTVDAFSAISLPVLNPPGAPVAAAWRWGLTASVGRSGITTGKFNALFYSDVAFAPNYSAGNLGNTIVIRPSQVKPALSFSIGGYVEHQLEAAMYFKGGAQLSRFSTTMFVGSFKAQSVLLRSTANMADKSIGSYYTAEHTQRYTNAYTFIDIPLSLGFNFATRTRLPFAWEIGVAPSIMLGSNALHFNQGSSIYYKDNSLFKKSQFALITSLPINVYNGNRYALFVAPSFRYNSSNLFLPEINEKKHLLSAGIGVSVNFKK